MAEVDAIKQAAAQHFHAASTNLDQGRFSQSIPEVQQAIAVLVKQPKGHENFKAELEFAAYYYQATHFLIELQRLQALKLYQQMGLVSRFLADIPVPGTHRVATYRIALKLNFQLGNFGIVGRLLRELLAGGLQLPEMEILKKMFDECQKHNFEDKCVPVKNSNRICFKTLRLIITPTCDFCKFCKATFRPGIGAKCSFCNFDLANVPVS